MDSMHKAYVVLVKGTLLTESDRRNSCSRRDVGLQPMGSNEDRKKVECSSKDTR